MLCEFTNALASECAAVVDVRDRGWLCEQGNVSSHAGMSLRRTIGLKGSGLVRLFFGGVVPRRKIYENANMASSQIPDHRDFNHR